jgi:DDE superfamily endonuclease
MSFVLIGACDGKHIRITCPKHTGTEHYNYKNFFSNVLLAVVDADYKFVIVDIGAQGSMSDGGILANSSFGKELYEGKLPFPPSKLLPGSTTLTPSVIVGDSGFQLKRNLMRPYPATTTNVNEKVFNYRLSRARRVSENAFGIMARRFRIFQTSIDASALADDIIKACVVLHNYIMTKDNTDTLAADGNGNEILRIPEQNEGLVTIPQVHNIEVADEEGVEIRERFTKYFVSHDGGLPWQTRHVTRIEIN